VNKVERTPDRTDPTKPRGPSRPFLLSLFLWMIGLWALLGWLRFSQTIAQRELILETASAGIFWYLILAGLLWGVLWIPLVWGWISGARWMTGFLWGITIFYPASYWVERLFLWQDPTGQQNWLFMLLLTALWLGLVMAAWRSPRVRKYFEFRKKKRTNE